jgi:kinetochore protein Mis13/DSN1
MAPSLDAFAAGIHDIELYRQAADNLATQVLSICAQRLAERDSGGPPRRSSRDKIDSRRRWKGKPADGGDGHKEKGQQPEQQGEEGEEVEEEKPDLGIVLAALSRVERR